jgi:hypothetical protein
MKKTKVVASFILVMGLLYISCSKGNSNTAPSDPCAGIIVNVTGTITAATSSQNNGSIAASATGGSGFTYSLNTGSFQTSGTFSNLAPGTYTITAKNSNGCTGSGQFTVNATNPCTSTITINTTTTTATPCLAAGDGSITVNASGSTNFTYNINGGAFQTSNVFNNLPAGSYSVIAKDASGCSSTSTVNVPAAAAGTLFSGVRAIVEAHCALSGCHTGTAPTGGIDFSVDCNIAANSSRIKVRAVDDAGTASQMPQPPNPTLSIADRQKISDWIAAGGKYTN